MRGEEEAKRNTSQETVIEGERPSHEYEAGSSRKDLHPLHHPLVGLSRAEVEEHLLQQATS